MSNRVIQLNPLFIKKPIPSEPRHERKGVASISSPTSSNSSDKTATTVAAAATVETTIDNGGSEQDDIFSDVFGAKLNVCILTCPGSDRIHLLQRMRLAFVQSGKRVAFLCASEQIASTIPFAVSHDTWLRQETSKWKSVDVLLIDEIHRMASTTFVQLVDSVKGHGKTSQHFGHVQVVVTADFHMPLPFVRAPLPLPRQVFKSTSTNTSPTTTTDTDVTRPSSNISIFETDQWIETFHIRQLSRDVLHELQYAQFLLRMRTGKLTETDIAELNKRSKQTYIPAHALHVYSTRKLVQEYNEKRLEQLDTPLESFSIQVNRAKYPSFFETPKKVNKPMTNFPTFGKAKPTFAFVPRQTSSVAKMTSMARPSSASILAKTKTLSTVPVQKQSIAVNATKTRVETKNVNAGIVNNKNNASSSLHKNSTSCSDDDEGDSATSSNSDDDESESETDAKKAKHPSTKTKTGPNAETKTGAKEKAKAKAKAKAKPRETDEEKEIEQELDIAMAMTATRMRMLQAIDLPLVTRLRIHARVALIRDMALPSTCGGGKTQRVLVRGSMGTIVSFITDEDRGVKVPIVRFDTCKMVLPVHPQTWTVRGHVQSGSGSGSTNAASSFSSSYSLMSEFGALTVFATPLMLCFAISMMALQDLPSQTLVPALVTRIDETLYSPGQAYLAASRVHKIQDLYLTSFKRTKMQTFHKGIVYHAENALAIANERRQKAELEQIMKETKEKPDEIITDSSKESGSSVGGSKYGKSIMQKRTVSTIKTSKSCSESEDDISHSEDENDPDTDFEQDDNDNDNDNENAKNKVSAGQSIRKRYKMDDLNCDASRKKKAKLM